MLKKYFNKFKEKVSIEYLRNQIIKNSYGNKNTIIAGLDPRVIIIWYLFFSMLPWFTQNIVILFVLFIFMVILTIIVRVAPLVLFFFCLGVLSESGYLFIVSLFFGGNLESVIPILILTLKITTVSLASLVAFSSISPDSLALGFLWLGFPSQFVFAISYSYRILPILLDEFNNILLIQRMRGESPEYNTFLGKIRYIIYRLKCIILAFYPFMLNMAKRSRTTIEVLVLRGYMHSLTNPKVKKIKLASLHISIDDWLFVMVSVLVVLIGCMVSIFINSNFSII